MSKTDKKLLKQMNKDIPQWGNGELGMYKYMLKNNKKVKE